MDESELTSILLKGENESVDFKVKIDLDSAGNKAEFVKDVISIANSASTKGYLIIGVDNSANIIGINKLEEEQIQQIAYTYISPAVIIDCSYVLSNDTEQVKKVGIIEIKALKKPHKVCRTLHPLIQDDVFIRRGSVVMKASPEEIIIMHNNSAGISTKIHEIRFRAEAHLKINNLNVALRLYSEAIDMLPTADLLICRAKIYEDQDENLLAFTDYTNSLKLNPSINEEKAAKLGRLRQYNKVSDNLYPWEDFEKNYNWLRDHCEGYERGETICTYINSWDYLGLDSLDEGESMVSIVDEAISLGYDNPEIFYFRSIGNKAASNFGIALRDIDIAISKILISERKVVYLCHRAEVLVSMKKFQEAFITLEEATKLDKDAVRSYLSLGLFKLDEQILCLFGLEKRFYGEDFSSEPANSIVRLLLLWHGRKITGFTKDSEGRITTFKTNLDRMITENPNIISSLMPILRDEDSKGLKNLNIDHIFRIKLPSSGEQRQGRNTIIIQIPLPDDETN